MKPELNVVGQPVTSLVEKICTCGDRVIYPDKVETYKTAQLRANTGNWVGRVAHRLGYNTNAKLDQLACQLETNLKEAGVLLIAGGITLIGWFAATFGWNLLTGQGSYAGFAWFLGGLITGGGATWLGLYLFGITMRSLDKSPKLIGPAFWKQRPWSEHDSQTSPEQARRIVSRIKAMYPGLKINIDELVQNQTVIDPILWISDPDTGEEAAVFVWDEFGNEVAL